MSLRKGNHIFAHSRTEISLHYFCLGLIGLFPLSVSARLDQIPGSRYTSAQVAAQGDAALALPDDVMSGLFYNPAILGKIKKAKFEFMNIALSPSWGFLTSSGTNPTKIFNLNESKQWMSSRSDLSFGSSGRYSVSFGVGGWALGLLAQAETVGKAIDPGWIHFRSNFQLIPSLGYGRSFLSGLVRLGYSLQWVNQSSGAGITPLSESMTYVSGLTQGSGFSHQAGLALTLPFRSLPEFGVIARNIGGMSYSGFSLIHFARNSPGIPSAEPMTIDGVVSFHPAFGSLCVLHLSLAYRDLTNRSSIRVRDHFALGAELALSHRVMLRGGMRGVFPSFGLGYQGRRAELSLAYYVENVGLSSLEVRSSQLIFQYSLRAF